MNSKNYTILLVEDEPEVLSIIDILVSEYSNYVLKAVNGEEGLNIVKDCIKNNKIIDLIISDINMPRLNGVDFFREIRALGFNAPFIFFTAHGSEMDMKEALRLKAFNFIGKPDFIDLEQSIPVALEFSEGKKAGMPYEYLNLNHYLTLMKSNS